MLVEFIIDNNKIMQGFNHKEQEAVICSGSYKCSNNSCKHKLSHFAEYSCSTANCNTAIGLKIQNSCQQYIIEIKDKSGKVLKTIKSR
jgi:hypothetical protein